MASSPGRLRGAARILAPAWVRPLLLGTGGPWCLLRPRCASAPPPPPTYTHALTPLCTPSVAWNPQAPHILGTATQSGSCLVWDLRTNRPYTHLKDQFRAPFSAISWNPVDSVYLVTGVLHAHSVPHTPHANPCWTHCCTRSVATTLVPMAFSFCVALALCAASDDDAHPLLRVWDLRAHSTTPLAELRGHTKAVLSLSWCPQDAGMLLTCGKDNRTLLWDMAHGTLMYELPVAGSGSIGVGSGGLDSMGGLGGMGIMGGGGGGGAAGLFGGPSLGVAVGRRYEVKWAPKLPGIVASCSFDRTVAVHSLAAIPGDHSTRAPSWLRRPSGASFGFCGKLVSFTQGGVLGPAPAAGYAVPR